MTRPTAILYLVAIFLAGGVAGAVLGWSTAISKPPHGARRDFSRDKLSEKMRQDLRDRLGLTPQQIGTVEPILQRRVEELQAIHLRSMEQVDEVFRRTDAELTKALNLTSGQQAALEQMARERREFMERRTRGEGHPGSKPPGGPPP